MLVFAVEIYWLQLGAGRHFLHEHPATASSWRERIVLELRRDDRVGEIVGDQCCCGLRTVGRNRDWADEEGLYRSGIQINPPKGKKENERR